MYTLYLQCTGDICPSFFKHIQTCIITEKPWISERTRKNNIGKEKYLHVILVNNVQK